VLSRRAGANERMDALDFSRQEVLDTFRFIEPVNRWFGGRRPIISFFDAESRAWDRERTYRVLDVGCGSGDIPVALARWARRTGHDLQVDAIDSHPDTVALARETCGRYPEITVSRRDMFDLRGESADYVLACMFLHHISDERIPSVLAHLLAQCRLKVVVNDLLRAPLAYLGTWLFSLPASAVFRHDARLSVRKGFTVAELRRMLSGSSLQDYRLERHFFYRFLLILSKEGTS